jgi:hypothetical protein
MAKSNLVSAMRKSAQPTPAAAVTPATSARPGRDHKSPITGFFGLDVKKQLRILAAEQSKTIQRLLSEALNDLFEKYKKPAIIPLDE